MDASTLSAYAAACAAGAAGLVAAIQAYVGHRQSRAALVSANAAMMNAQNVGRHTIAEFRQKWIDTVIETLSEYHAILTTMGDGRPLPPEDNKKLSALRTKLEILLNPDETDTIALLKATDEIRQGETQKERSAKSTEMVQVARRLLKTEWVRFKTELE